MMVSGGRQGGRRVSAIALAAALLATLAGCGEKERPAPVSKAPPPPPPSTAPAEPAIQPQVGLNPTQRLARVVELLNAGDEKTARVELAALRAESPGMRQAEVLHRSIEGNPYDLVPRGSFSYIVEPGDTYITLARDYLGDSYKFYALARISGIAADKLKPGDIIQIPGRLREPGRSGTAPRRTAPVRTPRREAAPATAGTPAPAAAPMTNPAEALRLRRQGLERMTAGQINVAVERLTRAQRLDPNNGAIAADLARARRIQGAVRTRR
ncbi:LysM domain-containing protein [Sphingomonas jatrophae]|uniref:LysM domain-containing protein n=2 Tax=Sphingomonas jatrophae TaxID=1166337 RepID=A0A1I6M213_9SPHN|nr:LysM domain-containing protein [Sphingomonas jatrophae]